MSVYIGGQGTLSLTNIIPMFGKNGWYTESATVSISGDVATLTCNAGSSGSGYTYWVSGLKAGHTMYARGYCAASAVYASATPHVRVFDATDWSTIANTPSVSSVGSLMPTSAIGVTKRNGDATFKCETRNSTGNEKFMFSKPLLVDLTATFGAGNEPTKDWCDAIIPDFFGTATISMEDVAVPVRKIYIGDGGTAKRVRKAYMGYNGVARLVYSAWYTYLRWTITRRRGTGDNLLQASEIRLVNSDGGVYSWPAGTTITANLPAGPGEGVDNLIDNDVNTKYCATGWGE